MWWWVMGKCLAELSPTPYQDVASLAYSQVEGSQEVLGIVTSSPRAHKEHLGWTWIALLFPSHPIPEATWVEGLGLWVGYCSLPVP